MSKETRIERNRERIDTELALTSALLVTARRLAAYGGWRMAVGALYYVMMRISNRGRAQLAEFLSDPGVGW